MRAQYSDLANDEEAGLGAGGGAAGADLRAAGGLVSLGEKQPGGGKVTKIPKYIPKMTTNS